MSSYLVTKKTVTRLFNTQYLACDDTILIN